MILTETPATTLRLDDLVANPDNPRSELTGITELAESITELGVLSPLLVVEKDGYPHHPGTAAWARYMVVDGHRRLAALQHLEFDDEIPVRVVEMTRTERLLAAVTTQGEPLSPLDEARAFQQLIDLGMSQRDVATKCGRNQSHVSRRLSLLSLDDDTKAAVNAGTVKVRDAEAKATGKPAPKPKVQVTEITPDPEMVRVIAENNALREKLAKARDTVAEVRAELEARPDAVVVHGLPLPLKSTPAYEQGRQYVAQCDMCGTLVCVPSHDDAPVCDKKDLGYCPACQSSLAGWSLQRPPVGMFDVPSIDDDTCLGCNGTGLWNGLSCSDCQPDPGCSDDDDAPGITVVAESETDALFDEPTDPAWATKPPWGTYKMSDAARICGVIAGLTKADSLRHTIEWEQAHEQRAEVIEAARARLAELS